MRDMASLSISIYGGYYLTSNMLIISEIEEMRHIGPSTGPASTQLPSMDHLVAELDTSFSRLGERVELARSAPLAVVDEEGKEELAREWEKASRQYTVLKDEMREDGWLGRFRR